MTHNRVQAFELARTLRQARCYKIKEKSGRGEKADFSCNDFKTIEVK